MDQVTELTRRAAYLDNEVGGNCGPLSGLEWFIMDMGRITAATLSIPPTRRPDPVAPSVADAIMERCELLSRYREIAPEVVTGPLRPDQFWIATCKPHAHPRPRLSRRHFIDVADAASIPASTKPFYMGLFTSTGLMGIHGMWELYLRTTHSTLYLKPWHVWAVRPHVNVRVREISTAADWAEFVSSYPFRYGDLVYPDWRSASHDHDAVHMTLQAVAATQGIFLRAQGEILAPTYWDVESTLWLRWCFSKLELIRVVDPVTGASDR